MALKTAKGPALWPAFGVGLLALLWLAQEVRWLPLSLPLGPIALFAAGMAIALLARERA